MVGQNGSIFNGPKIETDCGIGLNFDICIILRDMKAVFQKLANSKGVGLQGMDDLTCNYPKLNQDQMVFDISFSSRVIIV